MGQTLCGVKLAYNTTPELNALFFDFLTEFGLSPSLSPSLVHWFFPVTIPSPSLSYGKRGLGRKPFQSEGARVPATRWFVSSKPLGSDIVRANVCVFSKA